MDVDSYLELEGKIFTALVTPMFRNKINFHALERLLEYVNPFIDGVIVCGTMGNDSSFGLEEKIQLIKFVDENIGRKKYVIVGNRDKNTREAIKSVNMIEEKTGIYTHLQISPNLKQNEIYKHYAELANGSDGNFIAYSCPKRTGGNGILPETAKKIAGIKNILGIKDSSGDLDRIKKTIELTVDEKFSIICGDDKLIVDAFNYGKNNGRNRVSVISGGLGNVVPFHLFELVEWSSFENGKFIREAYYINEGLKPFYRIFSLEDNPIISVHYALKLIGINAGVPRSIKKPTEKTKREIRKVLKDYNLTGIAKN
jgi:4-hydroxy-tetrahydrodipicolinate synthase